MFGTTFPWMKEWVPHVQHLGQYGFEFKIFTPNTDVESVGNVEFVPMTTDQFNDLVEKKLGVRPNMYTTEKGVPSVHVTDFIVANGRILEDYLKDSDFIGMTNLDVVFGRLDHFVPDNLLESLDMFSDDVDGVINGVFTLFRNTDQINDLFKEIPQWKEVVGQSPCKKCTGEGDRHSLFGSDEYLLTDVMKKHPEVRFGFQRYFPFHSHDRLENHVPDAKLTVFPDGSLFELLKDTAPPNWIHARPFIGREVAYYHFNITKRWPPLSTAKVS